jgi:hypothetical protein
MNISDECLVLKNWKRQIPQIVAGSCLTIAKAIIEEYEIDHPNLLQFLEFFRGFSNVAEYGDFYNRCSFAMKEIHREVEDSAIKNKIDRLYEIGIIGVLVKVHGNDFVGDRYYCPARDEEKYYFDFHYKNSKFGGSRSLKPDDTLGFHPVFFDRFGLKPHDNLIVG